MSSTIIDLTQDSPSMYSTKENLPFPLNAKSANVTISSYHSTRLPPLSEVLNYAQPPSARPQWTKPIVSIALEDAIDTMDEKLLRNTVKEYCATLPELREGMEKFLVRGRDVVQYHDDTESEGDVESEEENEEQEEHEDVVKVKKPIAIGDDDFTPRFAECEYCNEKFDVSSNNYRTCYWHTGDKEADHESDFWADHDEDCHGRIDDFVDEPDYGEGFIWSCCNEDGNNKGCQVTKHKVKVNVIVEPPLVSVTHKRKAEEELPRPQRTR